MQKKCLLCGKRVPVHTQTDIPFKNIALRSWVANCLCETDLCSKCEQKYIKCIQDLYLKIQDTLSDTDSMIRQYTEGMTMQDVIKKHPDGDFEKLFNKLLKESIYLREDFGLLVIKVGWHYAYSRLDLVKLSAIMGLSTKDVADILLKEVPEKEWRWDLKCCNEVGYENCASRISIGPPETYDDVENTSSIVTGYEQLTLQFD